MTNTFVIRLGHEAAQRRKTTAQKQSQIADLASREIPRRKVPGLRFELGCSLLAYHQVDEFAAVRRYEVVVNLRSTQS